MNHRSPTPLRACVRMRARRCSGRKRRQRGREAGMRPRQCAGRRRRKRGLRGRPASPPPGASAPRLGARERSSFCYGGGRKNAGANHRPIIGRHYYKNPERDLREGFKLLGHSNWTIYSPLSPFCSRRFSTFSPSYWEANSYYPRGLIMGKGDSSNFKIE